MRLNLIPLRCALLALSILSGFTLAPAALAQSVGYTYDSQGRVISRTYPNGTVTTFTYDASDNLVQITTAAPSNLPPVAVNDATSTNSNTPKALDPRVNDSDPEGGALTIVSVATPSSGTAVVTGGGTGVTYTPASNFTGTATFLYTVRDAQNATASATVTVTVNNQSPVAVADSRSTAFNTPLTFDPRGNDTDPESQTLTVHAVTQSANGSVTFNGTSITFTPTSGFSGQATFTYVVRDAGNAQSGWGNVTVTVGANQSPVAVADARSTAFNTPVTFDPRVNDTDPENQALTVHAVTQSANGSVTFNGTSITFTPTSGFSGQATFNYVARDAFNAQSGWGPVTVTVAAPVNQPPVAVNDTLDIYGYTQQVLYGDVNWSANDSDPNGNPLTVISVTQPAGAGQGSVAILGGGSVIQYTSGTNNIAATFSYTISDGQGGTASATVSVQITRESPE